MYALNDRTLLVVRSDRNRSLEHIRLIDACLIYRPFGPSGQELPALRRRQKQRYPCWLQLRRDTEPHHVALEQGRKVTVSDQERLSEMRRTVDSINDKVVDLETEAANILVR